MATLFNFITFCCTIMNSKHTKRDVEMFSLVYLVKQCNFINILSPSVKQYYAYL